MAISSESWSFLFKQILVLPFKIIFKCCSACTFYTHAFASLSVAFLDEASEWGIYKERLEIFKMWLYIFKSPYDDNNSHLNWHESAFSRLSGRSTIFHFCRCDKAEGDAQCFQLGFRLLLGLIILSDAHWPFALLFVQLELLLGLLPVPSRGC